MQVPFDTGAPAAVPCGRLARGSAHTPEPRRARPLGVNGGVAVEKNQPANLEVELSPAAAEGIYANLVLIAHSPSEVILDFARVLPNVPKARVYSRIVMTPQHAKSLLMALEQNLKAFEGQFGPIKLPGENDKGSALGFRS